LINLPIIQDLLSKPIFQNNLVIEIHEHDNWCHNIYSKE
jgi:hypothetical protein